jgi:cytochrome c-type biogenesis protein CcmH
VIGLWIVAGFLAVLVAALLAWPLFRRPATAARVEYDLSVYRDQLKEIERDLERGLLDPAQAETTRVEIQRRMLAAAETATPAPAPAHDRRRRVAVAGLAVLVPIAGVAFYLVVGAPGTPDFPYAQRTAEIAAAESRSAARDELMRRVPNIDEAIRNLRARLEREPGDLEGWLMLARSSLVLERYDEAAEAYGRAYRLSNRRPDIAGDYAEALITAGDGTVTPEARRVIEGALASDPMNPKARYYLGLAKAQSNDVRGALQEWVDLVALSPPDAPWLVVVREQVARAGQALGVDPASIAPSPAAAALTRKAQTTPPEGAAPGPTLQDMEAAGRMSTEERTAMIRGMVERLAARLQANPNDREGWRRLARAYEVLGETEKAKDARARAEALGN